MTGISPAAISIDLFGTLVRFDRPEAPAAAIADQLERREIAIPDDWDELYHFPQKLVEPGREQSLTEHVTLILNDSPKTNTVDIEQPTIEAAVREAFETPVETPPEAVSFVEECAERFPTGVLSNCSVPGLVECVLSRSGLDETRFDAVVTSVDCGWRKPHSRAFEIVAEQLNASPADMVHIGDTVETDGGITDIGGERIIITNPSDLAEVNVSRWN